MPFTIHFCYFWDMIVMWLFLVEFFPILTWLILENAIMIFISANVLEWANNTIAGFESHDAIWSRHQQGSFQSGQEQDAIQSELWQEFIYYNSKNI